MGQHGRLARLGHISDMSDFKAKSHAWTGGSLTVFFTDGTCLIQDPVAGYWTEDGLVLVVAKGNVHDVDEYPLSMVEAIVWDWKSNKDALS